MMNKFSTSLRVFGAPTFFFIIFSIFFLISFSFSNFFFASANVDAIYDKDVDNYAPQADEKCPFEGDGVEEFKNSIGGYIEIDEVREGDKLFYWLFPSRINNKDEKNIPLILWLTGGPGCSSSLAALAENGPIFIDSDNKILSNPYSWNELGHLLFVDQPLGTGFSIYSNAKDIPRNEETVAADMVIFLANFVKKYPKFAGKDFFVTGESYAGHYIPALSSTLVRTSTDVVNLNFLGMAIGNGWINPLLQYPAYASFGYMNNLIDSKAFAEFSAEYLACMSVIQTKNLDYAWVWCNGITNQILGDLNPYDIRMKCEHPPLCYDFSKVQNFLNHKHVQKHLGVDMPWQECSSDVYDQMVYDWMNGFDGKITEVLAHGKTVLMYHGDKDFICNWVGGAVCAADAAMKEANNVLVTTELFSPWYVDDKKAGEYSKTGKFTFLKVYDGGHMVPMDKPKEALRLIKEFLLKPSYEETRYDSIDYKQSLKQILSL